LLAAGTGLSALGLAISRPADAGGGIAATIAFPLAN
jgi:hypothetical protein